MSVALKLFAMMMTVPSAGGWYWADVQYQQEVAAVKALQTHGVTIERAYQTTDRAPRTPYWSMLLFDENYCEEVVGIDAATKGVRSRDIDDALRRLQTVVTLDLSYNDEITDETMLVVGSLHHLEYLGLQATGVTDVGLKHLRGHPNLRVLDIGSLGDAGASVISSLPALEVLWFDEGKVGDRGAAALAKMPKLADVHIADTQITDIGLLAFARCTSLQRLVVGGTKVTREGVLKFRKLAPDVDLVSDFDDKRR